MAESAVSNGRAVATGSRSSAEILENFIGGHWTASHAEAMCDVPPVGHRGFGHGSPPGERSPYYGSASAADKKLSPLWLKTRQGPGVRFRASLLERGGAA